MAGPSINFSQIRSHRSSQNTGFEELTRQLILADPPAGATRIEHRGPGADGGVEILAHFSDGTSWGWQSKFFVGGFDTTQVGQIKKSFVSALSTYQALTRYFVTIPRNLSGAGTGPHLDERARWDEFTKWAAEQAGAVGRTIELVLWDESELVRQLTQFTNLHPGILTYWFDLTALSGDWFRELFETVRADLGDRYSPEDHVDVRAQFHIDSLLRNRAYEDRCKQYVAEIKNALAVLHELDTKPYTADVQRTIAAAIPEVEKKLNRALARDWIADPKIDLGPDYDEGTALYKKSRPLLRWTGDDHLVRALRKADAALESIIGVNHEINGELLQNPILLLAGEAGSGKSHALGHAVQSHLADGGVVLLLLGQYFGAGDPWPQIASKVGLAHRNQSEILGALQAAALATGRPCLIAIDAINEAENPASWRHHLAGLVATIKRFDRLALVISCRSTYEGYCLPKPHGLVRVEHRGFEGNAAEAARKYLDKRGIDRPAMPFLAPEFTNPLFVATSCKALEARGQKAFPAGLDGLSDLFRFFVDGVQENLIRKGYDRIDPVKPVVWNALQAFAEELALSGTDSLPTDKARALLERYLYPPPAGEHQKTFLFRLEDEGLLRRVPNPTATEEEVSFTFQRFSDHFVAAAVLRLADSAANLARAMRKGGDFAHLANGPDAWKFAGVIEALMVQVPEKFGMELALIDEEFVHDVKLSLRGFVESLKLRTAASVTPRTVQVFELQISRRALNSETAYEALLELCSNPGHSLNGDYLHARLAASSMPDRDASWSASLFHGLERDGPISTLIEWAGSVDVAKADSERLRLVASTISWFFSTSDRRVRDRATKSLASLFLRAPELIVPTLGRFLDVNDPYVKERVLAASYGALLHLHNRLEMAQQAAREAYRVFGGDVVERHAVIRHYARRIIDLASARKTLPSDIDLRRCHPPYKTPRITKWPELKEIEQLEKKRGADDIVESTVGYIGGKGEITIAGDFGRYTMGGIGTHFSEEMRKGSSAHLPADEKRAFWDSVFRLGGDVSAIARDALAARAALDGARDMERFARAIGGSKPKVSKKVLRLTRAFEKVEAKLKEQLPRGLLRHYGQRPVYPQSGDDRIPNFPLSRAQRWVAVRSLKLGWSKKKHASIEQNRGAGWDRNDHSVERIGKKYQWIAYWELVGYLADYHWFMDWNGAASILDNIEDFDPLDIDASFFPPEGNNILESAIPRLAMPPTDFRGSDVAADLAWTCTLEDLPDVTAIVEKASTCGTRWWAVKTFGRDAGYMDKLESTETMRTAQRWIELICVPHQHVQAFLKTIRDTRISASDLFDRHHSMDRWLGEHTSVLLMPSMENEYTSDYSSLQFFRLARSLGPNRGGYDYSGAHEAFAVPADWIVTELDLRPEGPQSRRFVTPAGEIAFVDMRFPNEVDGAVVVNADLLCRALDEKGLVPIWLLGAEKDGGRGRGKSHRTWVETDRRAFGGMWWRSDGKWCGENWAAPPN